jgi:DNA-binding CsgD family transcriptional regulator
MVDEALELLPAAPTLDRARILDLASAVLTLSGLFGRARETAAEAARLAAEHGDPGLETNALTTRGWALALGGAHGDGLTVLQAARRSAQRRGDVLRLVRVELNLAEILYEMGRFDEAIDVARSGLDAARSSGVERTLGALLAFRLASALSATGRWGESDAVSRRSLSRDPHAAAAAGLHALLAANAADRGTYESADDHLAHARAIVGGPADGTPAAYLVAAVEVESACRQHRADDARQIVRDRLSGQVTPAVWPLLVVGAGIIHRTRVRPSPPADPDDLARDLRAVAARVAADTPLRSAYSIHFAAEIRDGSWPAVVTAWDRLGRPHAAAYARYRAAEAAIAVDRTAAGQWLREAAEQAERLGAQPLLDRVGRLARSINVTLTEETPTRPGVATLGLTDREAEVLRHLVLGRSNRQIAETLFISPKTVSVHVSHILEKLGVTSRGEAAAAVHRLRLYDEDTSSA